MLFCLVGYALLKSASRVYGDVFQTTFVVGTVIAIYLERRHIFKDKMLLCLLWALVLQILSWINATIQLPQLAQPTPDFGNLANLFFFIFIAYWLKGNIKSVYILWATMLVGFILSFYIHSPHFIQDLVQGANGRRIDFNVNNAQHPALWSGIAFLLLSYFIVKISYISLFKKKKKNIIIITFLLLFNSFFIFVIFATQTRQVFLGIITSGVFGPIIFILSQRNRLSLKIMAPLTMVLIILLFTINNTKVLDGLEKRTSRENNTYQALLSGNIDKVPYNSSGIRINIWYEAIGWIKERPILGSDQDVRDDVIKLSKRIPRNIKNKIFHLHNSFIEVTLSYGLLGLFTILFMFYWLLKSTSQLTPKGKFNEIKLIALIFLIYWFVVNNFESYFFSSTGLLVHNIMFGTIYTFYFTQQLDKERNETII